MVYAGGFFFGQSTKSNEALPQNIFYFINHCLHFFLRPDKRSFDEANIDENEVYLKEDNTGVVTYSEKRKVDPYKLDEKVFNKLHHSLFRILFLKMKTSVMKVKKKRRTNSRKKSRLERKNPRLLREKLRW